MNKFTSFAGWSALLFAIITLILYIILPAQQIAIFTCLLIFIINGLFFLISDRKNILRAIKTRTALHGMNSLILGIIILGILVFVNLLSYRHNLRFDHTATGYYTLAPQTKKVVSQLPREVKITAFLATAEESRSEFENLIEGYVSLSDKIKMTYIDPFKNPAITKQYGVTAEGTIVIESGKNETKVNKHTEENLTNGIIKVIKDEEKFVYFLDGHGEKNISLEKKEGYSQIRNSLEKNGFTIKTLLLLGMGKVPDDADLLIINGPVKPLVPEELEMLRTWLSKGGSLFILLDPPAQTKTTTGLENLVNEWGINLDNDIIIDPMARLSGGDFAAPIVKHYGRHGITKDFTLPTIFLLLRSVTSKPFEDVTIVDLLFSGPDSWAEKDMTADKVRYDEDVDQKGPIPIALAATRQYGTKNAPENPEKKNDAVSTDEVTKDIKANMVVVGDSDFASNNYVNLYGNGDFFLNTVSWLLKEETLISIRAKERKSSPLTLSATQGNTLFIFGTLVFPLIVAGIGTIIWWRRRAL
ncbi:MAG: GldG family protein [Nitrospinales bacterium]